MSGYSDPVWNNYLDAKEAFDCAQVRVAEQTQEIAKLRGEVSELLAASDADTMVMHDMDRELTRTKASLGRAVEALQRLQMTPESMSLVNKLWPAPDRDDVLVRPPRLTAGDYRAFWAVLSDPDGQRAGREWAAMRGVCAVAVDLHVGSLVPGGYARNVDRMHDALRRLEEVRNA